MRKIVLLLLSVFIFSSFILGQSIIENPEKPLSKNVGRVLKLEEVFRIKDIGSDYYFKYPRNLKLTADGCFFLADEEQLLKFSSEGKFIKNLFKKGQGPGEIEDFFGYHIYKNEIFIYDFKAVKIIQTDLNGNLIKQLKVESGPYNYFCGVTENWFVFEKDIFPPLNERKSKLQEMSCAIRLVSKDGETEKESRVFQRIMFLAPRSITSWTKLFFVLSEDSKKLYVSHTNEYLIELLDLKRGQVIKRFNRKYLRVKYKKRGWEDEFYKKHKVQKIKFESDVQGLFINNGLLWVKTSTKVEEKGYLIDVFNLEGKFVDSFYLNIDGRLVSTHEDFIFVREKDEDELISIVKYKIIE